MARMLHILIASMAICAALAAPAAADSMTVDCSPSSSELQDALNQAVAGDVITVAEGATCFGGFTLPQGEPITLQGGGSGATLDGSTKGNQQILFGDNPEATAIRNLTFQNGSAGNGGAIELVGFSPVTIEGNTFVDNSVEGDGGAVYINHFVPLFTADRGDGDTAVKLLDNVFGGEEGDGNTAFGRGGGAWVFSAFGLQASGNEFTGNRAQRTSGGGLYAIVEGALEVTGNAFTRNTAGAKGGGASLRPCTDATVAGNDFTANRLVELRAEPNRATREASQSPRGAGLHAQRTFCQFVERHGEGEFQVVQSDNRFAGNVIEAFLDRPRGMGAGESIEGLEVHSTDDRYVGNRIEDFGGAGGGLSIEGTGGFEGNNLVAAANRIVAIPEGDARGADAQPSGEGGGIHVSRGDVTELELFNATIVENTAADGSGIFGQPFDALTLHNSIAHPNNGAESEIAGFAELPLRGAPPGTRDMRYSIACQDGAAHPGEANRCVDPKLVAPADGDVHQTAASPSLDAGSDPLTTAVELTADYEGDDRILDGNGDGAARVDMGADEHTATPPEPQPTPTTPTTTPAAPQGAVLGAQQRSCVSRRAFRIRLRVPRGQRAVSATVRVNGKRVRVLRGRRLRASVVLRGLPKGRFAVRITIRLANGTTISGTRRYNTCRPRLPGDGPPRV